MEKVIWMLSLLVFTGCTEPVTPASEAKVWSSSSSNDGFANCPNDTSVVGGGFEIAENAQGPGRSIRVIASHPQGNGWQVDCVDEKGVLTAGCKAWVVCATVLR